MEDPSREEISKSSARQKSARASAKKSKRPSPASRPYNRSAANQLIKRGRNLMTRAEKWAGSAARIASPLTDSNANAIVIGVLGIGIGVAVGAMLPRMNVGEFMSAGASPSKLKAAPKRVKKRRG